MIVHQNDKGQDIGVTRDGENANVKKTLVWSDSNGDGERQPDEVTGVDGDLRFSGWYMSMTPDLTFYAGAKQFKVSGFTACGAPRYDLAHPVVMPANGLGSADGRLVLQSGEYGVDHGLFQCFDIASKKRLWTYPDNFVGVHGSHNAPPSRNRHDSRQLRSLRGCEVAGTDWQRVGDPHECRRMAFAHGRRILSHASFPARSAQVPLARSGCPRRRDGQCAVRYGGRRFWRLEHAGGQRQTVLQAGKTGFWNVEVTGLDSVRRLSGGGSLSIDADDVVQAGRLREGYLQAAVGAHKLIAPRLSPSFTGNLAQDFPGVEFVSFKKQDDAAVRAAVVWDDSHLYLAYEVNDATPWVNGADAPEFLYARGDTVDLQLVAIRAGQEPLGSRRRRLAAVDRQLQGDAKGGALPQGGRQEEPQGVQLRRRQAVPP